MFNNSEDCASDLACLRLASDLMQMSRDSLNPDLQAHCIQMAKYWSDRADSEPDIGKPRDRQGS